MFSFRPLWGRTKADEEKEQSGPEALYSEGPLGIYCGPKDSEGPLGIYCGPKDSEGPLAFAPSGGQRSGIASFSLPLWGKRNCFQPFGHILSEGRLNILRTLQSERPFGRLAIYYVPFCPTPKGVVCAVVGFGPSPKGTERKQRVCPLSSPKTARALWAYIALPFGDDASRFVPLCFLPLAGREADEEKEAHSRLWSVPFGGRRETEGERSKTPLWGRFFVCVSLRFAQRARKEGNR